MKTVQSTEEITLEVKKEELLEGKYFSFQLVSKRLSMMEQEGKMPYKNLRNRLYNSKACGKYNLHTVAGITCIDVETPMKGNASLVLSFKRV